MPLKQTRIIRTAHVDNARQLIYIKFLFPVAFYVFYSFYNFFPALVVPGGKKNKYDK
jgi:hypothetical protein